MTDIRVPANGREPRERRTPETRADSSGREVQISLGCRWWEGSGPRLSFMPVPTLGSAFPRGV